MQFRKGANVLNSSGEKLGEIERVVIDPQNGSITHLVIQKGFLFPQDKVISVDQVMRTSDDAVYTEIDADHIDELPDYIETNFLPLDETELGSRGFTPADASPVYWYPAVGAGPLLWGRGYWGMYPPTTYEHMGYRVAEEENIPEGTVALKEGARVLGKDGKHIGDLEKVLTDNQKDKITHLVVTKGLFGNEKKLIPAHWIGRVREDAVQLSVDEPLVNRLRDYQE